MSDEEHEWIDAIVIGFDEEERILASPTATLESARLSALVGEEALYEDFNGTIWRGKVIDVAEDVFVVVFKMGASSELPPGLGAGSLLKLPAKPAEKRPL
ncbi:MAG: hypothetical protein RMJ28_03760 [Nitrososphaerota archaeon]|nr:hypothetical protein [Candidatus Calditenuaceae archaeon]MDW8073337.1 hypothetical protein [Nitrososphaerota archaeon]